MWIEHSNTILFSIDADLDRDVACSFRLWLCNEWFSLQSMLVACILCIGCHFYLVSEEDWGKKTSTWTEEGRRDWRKVKPK